MRLLRTDTLQLEEFTGDYNGQYAILSHTWEEGEVSLQDMLLVAKDVHLTSPEAQTVIAKAGYRKIKEFARVAAADGFSHVWADTCCIDKTSSAELSEAINSMFRWYKNGARCYVYLADVPDGWDDGLEAAWLLSGRWFTRGWTLQELIAPADLVFYSSTWTLGPTKEDIITTISQITGIDVKTLATGDCSSISVADRMRWASMRATTRIEDMAYCLLGIFDVNMPMLYGEGEKAFLRLQEEICRNSNDHTLFAWRQKRTAADMTWSS
ncbi:heterokaryon incompatibility protein-domain-containing protein, partial [Bombardia bombarda]